MTDNEIIKALESLLDRMRAYEAQQASIGKGLVEDIISMYDRQKTEIDILIRKKETLRDEIAEDQAEIERLQSDNVKLHTIIPKMLVEAKSEAIKEFAEKVETDLDKRVSKSIRNRNPHWYIAKRIVRETAIEMTEQSVNYESSKRMEDENENH